MRSGSLICVLSLYCSSPCWAQFPGVPPLEYLVSQRPVQTDLQLLQTQMQELGQEAARQRTALQKAMNLPSAERSSMLKELMLKSDQAIMDLLKPPQKHRLRQIHWQLQGCRVFTNIAVVQELELSADQQFRIAGVIDGFRGQANHLLDQTNGRPQRPDTFRKQLAEVDRPAVEQIHQLLTRDQRVRWKDALGKPYPSDLRLGASR